MLLSLRLSLLLLFSSSFAETKDYEVKVKTANKLGASTDAPVYIKVKGTRGSLDIRELDKKNHNDFEQGRLDTYSFRDWDIGYVTGLTVYLGRRGWFPAWNLDYILIRIAGAKDAVFNYRGMRINANSQVSLTLSCNDGNVVNSQGYCDGVDECQNPNTCISPATCENTVGSYKCHCPTGYTEKPGTNNECQDIDECSQGQGYCNHVRSTCVNLKGSYRCDCKSGYENNTPKNCININECTRGIDSCNKTSSYCTDKDGDFWCRCKTGYNQGANNKLCVAVGCGPLVTPIGGKLEPARCTGANSNFYGDKCVMKCQVGYNLSNMSHGILTCGSKGLWQGTMGTCNAVTCPQLSAISNGGLLPSSCTSSGGKYQNKCSYYCSSGYTLQGGQFRVCQEDGTWDGTAPTCKKLVSKPWIRCPDLITQDLLLGKSTADVSSVWKGPTSNVELAQITISPPEISSSYQFPYGTTKVTWTASNSEGSESCSIFVIIYDKEAPTISNCPQNIHEISGGPKAVTWVEPTVSDNVKVKTVDKSHSSGSTFQLGTTYVTYTAVDDAGNSAECKFVVQLLRPKCSDPDGPVGGTKLCSSFGGNNFCTVTCNSGSQLYKTSALFWQCDTSSGTWTPSDRIPDCVEASTKDPNTACQENRIEMTVTSFVGTKTYCAKCPTGTYRSSSTDCSPCPAGSYNDQQGQLKCTQCSAGTSSLPGAKSASDCKAVCSAGRFSQSGLGPNCQYCPRNTYQDKVQQKSCTPCPNGTHTLSLGASKLAECGARTIINRMEPLVSNIKEGETVSVDCYASGIPAPDYFWKFLKNITASFLGKMSQADIKDGSGTLIGSKLTITGATYENSGSYECRATNTHGEDKKIAQINVAKVNDVGSGSLDEPFY
ncbi:uncharacterized protein [Porites lutea]|uniref:uncharacterized protein isoform X2 n=1 Tax=Porites lutea TaxID=51062 RepID=UPI003CC61A98